MQLLVVLRVWMWVQLAILGVSVFYIERLKSARHTVAKSCGGGEAEVLATCDGTGGSERPQQRSECLEARHCMCSISMIAV